MGELVYSSVWLRDFNEQNMLQYWKRAIQEFPASRVSPGVLSLTIYPLDWGQAPVLEQAFPEGTGPEHVVALASEFLHDDYAYEVQLNWDIWMPKSPEVTGGWERTPRVVSITCLGAAFAGGESEVSGHLLINLGQDSGFLLPEGWGLTGPEMSEQIAAAPMRENLEQLLEYERRLEKKLPVTKRLLWCESGENVAEKIRSAWNPEL